MTAPFRVLVTGSRDCSDHRAVWRELDRLLIAHCGALTVVHGGCDTGADAVAWAWVRQMRQDHPGDPIAQEQWPANWLDGRRAGPERNTRMVAAGADLCLAFVGPCVKPSCRIRTPHGSHGATDCADKALAAGIEVRAFGPFAARWQQQILEAPS